MQIQKVQSNQQNFGTTVKMDPCTARILSVSKAKNKILKNIRQLQNNGADDILYLSLGQRQNFNVKASVYERNGDNYFISRTKEQPISYMMKNGRNRLVDIKKMYEEAKDSVEQVIIGKKDFLRFLQYIE